MRKTLVVRKAKQKGLVRLTFSKNTWSSETKLQMV